MNTFLARLLIFEENGMKMGFKEECYLKEDAPVHD